MRDQYADRIVRLEETLIALARYVERHRDDLKSESCGELNFSIQEVLDQMQEDVSRHSETGQI